jgi:glycosyltransferase involved in cell wall biosynthesis
MKNDATLLILLNKNEEKGLIQLLPQIDQTLFDEIICIDGGSEDNSISLLRSSGIKVLEQNSSGRGVAFKLAFDYAKTRNFDYLLFFSTDGNEDPNDMKKFVGLLNQNPDLIIASRMLPGSRNEEDNKIFRFRKLGNKFFSVTAFLLFSRKIRNYISDPINGYRALKFSTWKEVEFSSESFSIEFEISIKAYKNRFKVIEFETSEQERISGVSGAKAIKTTYAMIKILYLEVFIK